MEPRKLAALLSSLVSQLLLLLILTLPCNSPSYTHDSLPPLIHHFLFSHQIATTLPRNRNRNRNRKRKHPSPSHPSRTPDFFPTTFMMTSSTFQWLSGLLEPLLDCRDPAPLNLSPSLRLSIGLFRLATGSDYPQIASRFSVPLSVAKFCVKQLCRVLCTNFRFWVSFPNPSDLRSVSQSFHTLSGLPNCCGVVSCSRFDVLNANSIAAQIVVDSSFRILSIVAGFQGHKSDSTILRASTLFKDIEEGTLLNDVSANAVNQYLIGDSGYPLLSWLMVPFLDSVPGSVEENFNNVHEVMRVPALRTVASLKNWGVLSRPVDEEVKMAVAYTGACAILHNCLLMREDFSALAASGFEDHHRHQLRPRVLDHEDDAPVSPKALVLRSSLATMAKKIRRDSDS
ncbi:hypothetical protein RJT34_04608 [Clitoria ternatea]|uniref:DDE Tnp4 domain-containing protein n=1 Tax=Clitoria ternatea TaxID=43366 RepID=A0AAN9Q0Q5_CLITE